MSNKSLAIETIFTAIDKLSRPLRNIRNNITKTGEESRKFGSMAGDIFKGFLGADLVKGAVEKVFNVIKESTIGIAEMGNEAKKTAGQIGMSVEALQELRYAAKIEDVSQESMDTSLKKLNKSMGDLRAGTGNLKTYLERSNPALLNQLWNVKSTDQAFDLLIDTINKTPNTFDKAALAQAAFGRGGQEMIKIAGSGKKGLEKSREEARKLGIVMSDEAAASAEEFSDNLKRLKESGRGVGIMIGGSVLPMMNQLIKSTLSMIMANKGLIGSKIKSFFSGVSRILEIVTPSLNNLVGSVVNFASAFFGGFSGGKNTIDMVAYSLNGLINIITGAINIATRFSGVIKFLIGTFLIYNVILIATTTWTKIYTFATKALRAWQLALAVSGSVLKAVMIVLNIVMSASPIGVIIMAIAALIAIIILVTVVVIKNWGKIKDFFGNIAKYIKEKIDSIKQWFNNLAWPIKAALAVAFFPITLAIMGIKFLIESIKKISSLFPSKKNKDDKKDENQDYPMTKEARLAHASVNNSTSITDVSESKLFVDFSNMPVGAKAKATGSMKNITLDTGQNK